MNQGERDELIVQLKLIELRDHNIIIQPIGKIHSVKLGFEYSSLPDDIDFNKVIRYTDEDLNKLVAKCNIRKAGTRYKADTIINGIPVSVKSNNFAPPALVNHTRRDGFEYAAKKSGGSIHDLDEIIDNYWELRFARRIAEDISNTNLASPFRSNKEVLRPFLNYFLFEGTGSGLSKLPANKILGFTNPIDVNTWHFYDKSNAIDLYWDHLIFSLRAEKGMPPGYPHNMGRKFAALKPSIDKWTRNIDGGYRGALHIRTR